MVWRESFPPAGELSLDAEAERERRLVAQARSGADWALTALVARYQPPVTRYLTRLCGDRGRARALAERVFQRMERRLHGPHGGDNLRLWLLRASTEAGLEAIRHSRRAPAPRLDVTRVAGLLPSETGAQAQSVIEGGIKRLKRVAGAVSRQARPLVWKQEPAPAPQPGARAGAPAPGREVGPVDEGDESLDPYETLRHRLIRITLAELPYGDAQCLALHLVAGLNQAEVARALGITGSAARRRIVQGLEQFSTRYQTSVSRLGLPEELGYGDALPQVPVESLPMFAPPDPAPVVVPEVADEPITEALPATKPAPSTIPLTVESLDRDGEPTSGVAYYASSSDDIPAYQPTSQPPLPPGPDDFFTLEAQQAFEGSYDDAFSQPYQGPYAEPAGGAPGQPFAEPFEAPLDDIQTDQADEFGAYAAYDGYEAFDAEASAPGMGAGPGELRGQPAGVAPDLSAGVARIAADAIVGPVVDALPVDAEPFAFPTSYGTPSARSMPLSYELMSGEADAGNITMHWYEEDGTMAALSFEADAAEVSGERGGVAPGGQDDPWAASAVLDLTEMPTSLGGRITPVFASQESEDSPLPPDGSEAGGAPLASDLRFPGPEGDYAWERARDISDPEHGSAPPAVTAYALDGDTTATVGDPPASPGGSAAQRLERPSTRTLEDLWDEPPDALPSQPGR